VTLSELELQEEQTTSIAKDNFDAQIAEQLHRTHGKRIEVQFPSPITDHCYTLRSKGCVGHIPVTDDFLLRIRPKVPVENLFRMLEYAYKLRSFQFLEGTVGIESLEDVFERLASILSKRILDRARKGLYRDYVARQEPLPYLRGRLLVRQSLQAVVRGSVRLECDFEEHTPDLDENRILAWTLYQLPRFRLKRRTVRHQVRQAYRVLSNTVGVNPVHPKDCVGRFYHRLNEDYRPLHGLCRFFLEHSGPGIEAGDHGVLPFVLYMPALFESFVAEWLWVNLPGKFRLKKQFDAKLDDSGSLIFTIDLVLIDAISDQVLAVLDTKYKRKELPEADDVQQIVAYAVKMETQEAILVYPSTDTRCQNFSVGPVSVRTLVFDIGSDPDKAGHRFLNELEDILNHPKGTR